MSLMLSVHLECTEISQDVLDMNVNQKKELNNKEKPSISFLDLL